MKTVLQVLLRICLGKYAYVADLSKCFFQVGIHRNQQDLFRIVWFENNDLEERKPQIFRFTRHLWRINCSSYATLLALKRLMILLMLVRLSLRAVEHNRYMDNLLLSSDSLIELKQITNESMELFESRGFSLHKWAANSLTKQIL